MTTEHNVREGGNTMAVLAIRKPSAYIVKTRDKDGFMKGKADKASTAAIKDASEKFRKQCIVTKKK